MPHGLGLGGSLEGFRIFIPDSLESCTARSNCPTYEAGKLLLSTDQFDEIIPNSSNLNSSYTSGGISSTSSFSSSYSRSSYTSNFKPTNIESFTIDTLEVWGCGGNSRVSEALSAQSEHRKLANKALEKARKVDKAAFFNNDFDREFLLGQTTSHSKHNRADV